MTCSTCRWATLMRGERATLGKSLLDVERELRIRATYVAAIENGDIGAFQSAGFIAGYVRSYARYLGMEPERTFQRFCEETRLSRRAWRPWRVAGAKKPPSRMAEPAPLRVDPNDVMRRAPKLLAPTPEPWLQRLEPGALGSIAVLLVLAAGIGYGAWAILSGRAAAVDRAGGRSAAPLAQLDPLTGANGGAFEMAQGFDIAVPGAEGWRPPISSPEPLGKPGSLPRATRRWPRSTPPDEVGTLSTLRQPTARNLRRRGPAFRSTAPPRCRSRRPRSN